MWRDRPGLAPEGSNDSHDSAINRWPLEEGGAAPIRALLTITTAVERDRRTGRRAAAHTDVVAVI
jgi:hypothetical protein